MRDGYSGYTGTRDTTIYGSPSDYASFGFVGTADVASTAGTSIDLGQSPLERAYGLISFDVSGLTDDMLNTGETCAAKIDVLRADLDLFASVPTGEFITVTPLKTTAPAWTESGATFTSANGTDAWTVGGSFPSTPALNDTNIGYQDAYDGVPNSGVYRHITIRVPTDTVLEWVCDATKNRGVLVRLHSSTTANAKFFTREFSHRTFRPMLTIYLKRK